MQAESGTGALANRGHVDIQAALAKSATAWLTEMPGRGATLSRQATFR